MQSTTNRPGSLNHKSFLVVAVVCVWAGQALADTTVWNFTGGNFTPEAGGVGTMEFFNGDATFGTFGNGNIGGGSTGVLNFTAATPTQGLQVTHNSPANGGGALVNQYTLIMDVNFSSLAGYTALYQTDMLNESDGDWFINSSGGIGIGGDYQGDLFPSTWYRLGLVVDSTSSGNSYRKYIDGVEVGVQGVADTIDDRWAIDSFFLLLTDENDETNAGSLSSVLFTDRPLNAIEMGVRGGPTADGIPATITLPVLEIVIDRDNGQIQLENNTGFGQDIKGYSILSADGALIEENASFFADTDSNWIQFTAPGATGDLSEGHLTTGSIANTASIDLGNAWLPYYRESADITFEYLDGTGALVTGAVSFTGNGGSAFALADLNFDGNLDGQDWLAYKEGLGVDLSGLSAARSYRQGDLTADGANDYDDFLAFKTAYDAVNGGGAFAAMLAAVPEPTSIVLLALAGLFTFGRNRAGCMRLFLVASVMVLLGSWLPAGQLRAQLPTPSGLWEFNNPADLTQAAIGNDLVLAGNNGPGAHTAIAGIGGSDGAVSIGVGSYYQATPGIAANGGAGANFVNEFTLIYDLKYPASSVGNWRALFATNNDVSAGDADYFIHPSDESWGVGDLGYTDNAGTGEFFSSPDTWYRVVMAVNLDDDPNEAYFNLYIDGVLTGQHNVGSLGLDGRFSLYASSDPNPIMLFSGDNDGEDAQMHYSNIAIWDRPLTPFEITALGGPDPDGIDLNVPVPGITLQVNTTTGNVTMLNNRGIDLPEAINFYEILSPAGALNATGWNSLDDQGTDSLGSADGQSWDEGGGSDANLLTEAFLLGTSQFNDGRSIDLGTAFDPSQFGQGQDGDLEFYFGMADSEQRLAGRVEYVSGGFLSADFNTDTFVDGQDLAIWNASFGVDAGGDADSDGDSDGNDFLTWQLQHTGSPLATPDAVGVPEPRAFGLLLLGLAGLILLAGQRTVLAGQRTCLVRQRPGRFTRGCWSLGIMLTAALVLGWSSGVLASSTNDREYWLGDDDGVLADESVSLTFDSMFTLTGEGGDQQNLTPSATAPTYVDVGPSGLARPGALANALGVAFDADGQNYLVGDRLGEPHSSIASGESDFFGPLDYSDIVDRGFQLWVRPGNGSGLQDVVMDTNQHGLRISEAGTWVLRYDGGDIDSGVAATPNQWAHAMVVRPAGGTGARLYVDGFAIAADSGDYNHGDNFQLVLGANTGAADSELVGTDNFFTGVLDDLEMFVLGVSFFDGIDYGTFDPAEDNPIIAAALEGIDPADVNMDGVVNAQDVDDFVASWLDAKTVNGISMGDLATRASGDLNLDGNINLLDWSILNAANPATGATIMAALQGVPEPASLWLLGSSLAWLLIRRRAGSGR